MKRLKIILQSKIFFVISLVFLIFYVLLFTKVIHYKSVYSFNTNDIEGIVLNYSIDGDKVSLLVKAKEKVQVSYYLKSEEEQEYYLKHLKIGMKVKLKGSIKEASNNTISNTFNYKKYLYEHQIYTLFLASDIKLAEQISFKYKIKNFFIERMNQSKETKAYMQAFILGDHGYMDDDVYQTYQKNGVTHLFAVSGMHIGILIIVLDFLLRKFKFRTLMISIILLFYTFLVGFSASVVRAVLFYIFLKLNKKLGWNLENKRVLYLLFILLVVIHPFYIYDLGFLYSFTTSMGLILFQDKIKGGYIKRIFLVSFIAFLFSLPITIMNFYEFNLFSIFNNLIIVPYVSVFLFPLTLLTFLFSFLNPILLIGIQILEFISTNLNHFSFMIVIPKVSFIFVFIYYAILYFVYSHGFKYFLFIIFLLLMTKIKPYLDSSSYVYFLDVGQGDSAFIVSAHQKDIIMIDTGGAISYSKKDWQKRKKEFDLSENLATFIKSLGISHIDLLVTSHGDMDHLGYAQKLSEKIKIKKVMFNQNGKNELERNLSKKILETKEFSLKNIHIKNLNSCIDKDENVSSLVLFMKIENMSFLFMGDAPKEVEEEIIKKYSFSADVLKVGHHGSKTSTSNHFIKQIDPKYSIISVGKNNRYGHPNEEVLDILKNRKVYRTDIDGSILFQIKKKSLQIKSCPS